MQGPPQAQAVLRFGQADLPIREVSGDGCISHGYRQVPVPPDERSLTRDRTYVLEHRLVMARTLGRPLEDDEVVRTDADR